MGHTVAVIFVFVSVIHLIGCLMRQPNNVRRVTKPLLMPLLTCSYCLMTDDIKLPLVLALLFGCAGDVLLLITRSSVFFFCGGICFCLGHISYIVLFLTNIGAPLPPFLLLAGLICFYAVAVYSVLHAIRDGVGNSLSIPVNAYLILVACMGLSSFICCYALKPINKLSWVGSFFFLFSDSLLLYNKFKYRGSRKRLINFCVMLTYLLAQSFIVIGMC